MFNIKVTKAFSTDVIGRYIEEVDEVESVNENFSLNEELTDVDVVSKNETSTEVQFGDGSVAWFPNDSIEITEENDD